MDEPTHAARAASFGGVARGYASARPGYPADAVRWLVGATPALVLELGAGTGKLTAELLRQGHRVIASEPSAPMLAELRAGSPGAAAVRAGAERIPFATSSVDVVIAAQAFHWFDPARALVEIARVLRPGGVLGLVWNLRDESVPWVRRLTALIGSDSLEVDPAEALDSSGRFDRLEVAEFRHWQQVFRDTLVGLVASRSYVATLGEKERGVLLAEVGELYDGYGRGPDGMLLPYVTHCFRARVSNAPPAEPPVDNGLLIDFP
ncbi:MAG: class I SAM-dependent methyltransferase [Propionibacteriales bacterium]|jgi:SAM-dependent methyltransferase|nr:class I SAM-dependent methyltransferase [Propionibacteriales bacterium]